MQKGDSLPLLIVSTRSARNAQAHQVVPGRLRAALAEREVVLRRAAAVAVAFERDLRRAPLAQPVGVLLQRRAALILQASTDPARRTRRPAASPRSGLPSVFFANSSSSVRAAWARLAVAVAVAAAAAVAPRAPARRRRWRRGRRRSFFLAQPAALRAIATTRAAARDSREPDIWATPERYARRRIERNSRTVSDSGTTVVNARSLPRTAADRARARSADALCPGRNTRSVSIARTPPDGLKRGRRHAHAPVESPQWRLALQHLCRRLARRPRARGRSTAAATRPTRRTSTSRSTSDDPQRRRRARPPK